MKAIIVFIILNTLDYITTKKGLKHGAIEFNPIADYFVQKDLLGIYKLGMVIIFFFLIWFIYNKRSQKRARTYIILANVLLAMVVFWNFIVIMVQMSGY